MAENIADSDRFEQFLVNNSFQGSPQNLYDAMNYIMQLGGKRMRPKLLVLSYQCCSGQLNEDVLKLGLSIETFHNFSLVHDDIMDNAPLRRGKKTVHEEWDEATAVLAGDNLLTQCYRLILETGFSSKLELLTEFTNMASKVCDGQQMDMNLPRQTEISESEYLEMIRLKTAVLPASALRMGAMAAGANAKLADLYASFGLNLGMAFQLQDDFLDVFGSGLETGKQEGGDILENKRTILYLHALKNLKGDDKNELLSWYNDRVLEPGRKVERVRALFRSVGSDQYLMKLKSEYETKAHQYLDETDADPVYKHQLLQIFNFLKSRKV